MTYSISITNGRKLVKNVQYFDDASMCKEYVTDQSTDGPKDKWMDKPSHTDAWTCESESGFIDFNLGNGGLVAIVM